MLWDNMAMEALSETSIRARLRTTFIGQHLLYFPRTTSTMDVARQAAKEGAAEGTLVIAEEQTSGRGRRGRGWLSIQGSLAFSLILHPTLHQLPSLVMVASLAVVHTIEALTPLKAGIKWPNDVLVGGKKVCGILIESEIKGSGVGFAIVGIGLNVNGAPTSLPPPAIPATSLLAEMGREVSRLEVLSQLLADIEQLYLAVRMGQNLISEWRQCLETVGQHVQVEMDGATIVGIAEDVSDDGSLLLRCSDGNITQIVAGDVSLRTA